MALNTPAAWAQPAFRVGAAALGSVLAGPIGCATGAFLGGLLGSAFGPSAEEFVAACVAKFGETAADRLLGPRLDSLVNKFKEHPSKIEEVYREAFRQSLVAIHQQVLSQEYEDWFENWEACLGSKEPLDLDQVQPGELVSQNLDQILSRTMQALDARGKALREKSLSLKTEFRPFPAQLAESIKAGLPAAFSGNFQALIVRPEHEEAWRQTELAFQGWLRDELARIARQLEELKEIVNSDFERVLRVVDSAFLDSQREGPLTQFLSISRGDWKLVAQSRAIERDLTSEVAERVLRPHDSRAVLQIVRGEPGSGKTTLLLEIGARLVESGATVVEVLKGAPLDEFRFFVTKLSRSAPGRLFVLVNDIYGDEDQAKLIVNVLSTLGEMLPVTIVATTPSFADRTGRIHATNYLEIFPPVCPDSLTATEIERFRKMPEFARLPRKQFDALLKSRRILVVMLQLTEGKLIDQILSDTAQRLRDNHPETYTAWGIVSLFSAHNLPIPSSLLNGILGNPYFTDSLVKTPAKIGSDGLLFRAPFLFEEAWNTGHNLIGQRVFNAEYSDTLRKTCSTAVRVASPQDAEHSVFLGRMVRFLLLGSHGIAPDSKLAAEIFREFHQKIRLMALAFPEGMADWATAFLALGHQSLAEQCLVNARPTTPARATGVVSQLEKLGKIRNAFATAREWMKAHGDDGTVRTYYLGLVQRHGAPDEVKDAVAQTAQWLKAHAEDNYVRTCYLGLVGRKGSPEDLQHAIAQTSEWLTAHPEDSVVRTAFLDLIEQKGTEEQVRDTIADTAAWLEAGGHGGFSSVRTYYLGFVERRAKPALRKAVDDTVLWLKTHGGSEGSSGPP